MLCLHGSRISDAEFQDLKLCICTERSIIIAHYELCELVLGSENSKGSFVKEEGIQAKTASVSVICPSTRHMSGDPS